MKVIVAGSRLITSYTLVSDAIRQSGFKITEIVSGAAPGVDRVGELWAVNHGTPCKQFIPKWNEIGKVAGMVRNGEMADYAEALVAVWNGTSPGTKNMINQAIKKGLKVYVYYDYSREGEHLA